MHHVFSKVRVYVRYEYECVSSYCTSLYFRSRMFHTYKVCYQNVSTNVHLQSTINCKLGTACFTFVWFLPCVSTNVHLQSTINCKLGTACFTCVRFLSCVSTNVHLQRTTDCKLGTACFTFVRFISGVITNVAL